MTRGLHKRIKELYETSDSTEVIDTLDLPLSPRSVRRWARKDLRDPSSYKWEEYDDGREFEKVTSAFEDPESEVSQKVDEVIRTQEAVNKVQISAESQQIKTKEGLVKAADIDTDEWIIKKFEAKSYNQGQKGPDGSPVVITLWSTSLQATKREVDEIQFPTIKPVEVSVSSPKTIERGREYNVALIIPDPHVGFMRDERTGKLSPMHDRKAFDVVRQVKDIIAPDRVICLGDGLDLPDWSQKFVNSPEMYRTTQPSLLELSWWLGQWGVTDYIQGNHCERLSRKVLSANKEAYGLKAADETEKPPALSVERLIGCDSLGIDYHGDYPNGHVWLNENTYITHGNVSRKGGGRTANKLLKDEDFNIIYGHCHRVEEAHKTIHTAKGPKTITAASPGCLCKLTGEVPSYDNKIDWQNGFGVAYYTEEDFRYQNYLINKGEAVFNGNLIEGKDYKDQIAEDTGWEAIK